MRAVFLADAHLELPSDDNYRKLLRFLDGLHGSTDTLFIMGDLFDFWVGFPSDPFPHYEPVLSALERLKQSGCRIIYFEGNHDFHMGSRFRQRLGAEIHTGPALLTVQGRRLFLCHGDQINRADHGYRLLRLMLHNPFTRAAVSVVPPSLALRLRARLQRTSRAGYHAKQSRWNYTDIVRGFGRQLRSQGCQGLVTGHFHFSLLEQLDGTPFTLLSLGDWLDQFTYGEMVDGELRLCHFHDA